MKVGSLVRVVSCDACPGVVNKVGHIRSLSEDGTSASVSFGKGRPQKGRPENFPLSTLLEEVETEAAVNSTGN